MEYKNYFMDIERHFNKKYYIEHFNDCLSLCIDEIDCQQCYLYGNGNMNASAFINWFDLLVNFFYFSGILLGSIGIGFFFACVFVGKIVYKPIKEEFQDDDFEDYLDYEEKYDKEFYDLDDTESNDNAKLYKSVCEESPNGTIIMTYNGDEDVFEYYADKKRYISYYHLETVAKRWCIENNCRAIFKTGKKSVKGEGEKQEGEKREGEGEKMFISLKGYNKLPAEKKKIMDGNMEEKIKNVYKFAGKIIDFVEDENGKKNQDVEKKNQYVEKNNQDVEKNDGEKNDTEWSMMSFADYKKMKCD